MHDAFLAAIVAEPDEMTHRFIYADWLEEHGSTPLDSVRADLIRTQIARESVDPAGTDFWELRARERAILGEHAEALAGPILQRVRSCRFRWGFVESVEVDAPTWATGAAGLARMAPVARVRIVGDPAALNATVLRGLAQLDLSEADASGLSARAQRSLVRDVRWRSLTVNATWGPLLTEALRQRPALERLGVFPPRTDRDPPPPLPLRSWLSLPRPRQLRALQVFGLREGEVPALLASPWLAGLESFHGLFFSSSDTFRACSACPNAAGWRELWCAGAFLPGPYPPTGPHLSGLRRCSLWNASADTVAALRQADAAGLEVIRLTLPQESFRFADLFRLPWWPRLRSLDYYGPVSHDLNINPYLDRLRHLSASGLTGTFGRRESTLAELWVGGREPTPLPLVSHSPALRNLTSLTLADARIDSPRDLEMLLDRDNFPRLRYANLGGVEPDESLRSRLLARFGAIGRHHPDTWIEE